MAARCRYREVVLLGLSDIEQLVESDPFKLGRGRCPVAVQQTIITRPRDQIKLLLVTRSSQAADRATARLPSRPGNPLHVFTPWSQVCAIRGD
jgi:hypothetical protein